MIHNNIVFIYESWAIGYTGEGRNMEHIYFKDNGNDSGFLTELDIVKAARIVEGIHINYTDNASVREYAKKCKGVGEEIKRPSVRYLVNKGNNIGAIRLYEDIHNCGIVEAKEAVDKMMEKLEA